MCYTIDGKQYPFLAKDELERQLPVLKKAYLKYSEVAGKSVDWMFYDLFKDYAELTAEELGSCCFINDGKGNFKKMLLPDDVQLAPVMAFASLNNQKSFLAGGNFYGVTPYEGRYDALQPTIITLNNKRSTFYSQMALRDFDGEVRDMKWIHLADGSKVLIIARNNSELTFLKPVQ